MSNSTETIGPFLRPEARPPSLRDWCDGLLADCAAAWQLSRTSVIGIVCFPAIIAASGIVAALAGKQVYKLYTEEDGVAEYMQAGLYAACFLLSLSVLRHHLRMKHRLIGVLYILLAAGLFFMVGEELSWGQRIVGWGTPPTLESLNKQAETNLHNIHGVGSTFKWVQGLVGAYGAFLPLVFWNRDRWPRLRPLIDAVVPHYLLIVFFLPMFVWRFYRNLAGDPSRYYYVVTNYNEVIELILAFGFFLFLIFQVRKCRQEVRGSAVPS